MTDTINLKLDQTTAHIIHMCIIEHWTVPRYQEELTRDEFTLLQDLREKFRALKNSRDHLSLTLEKKELSVLIKAYSIGLEEIDSVEFSTIVGSPYEQGKEVLGVLQETVSRTNQR